MLIDLFNTISIGMPGLTMPIFINSAPKSTDITATLSLIRNHGLTHAYLIYRSYVKLKQTGVLRCI